MTAKYVLGISCYYHDSAAALIKDGEIIAAVQEERFTRIKHDASFPIKSIAWMMKEFKLTEQDLLAVVYYEKPFITFERLIETHLNHAPFGLKNFLASVPVWIKEKLFLEKDISKNLKALGILKTSIKYSEHHLSHAASAFFPSPFKNAVVLCVDGVGEWATTSVWSGSDGSLKPLWEIHFPHSLGLLYSALTSYLGFKVNSGEYKVMGLAPYGKPIYAEVMLKELICLHRDGSYSLNMKYFAYGHKLKMFTKDLEILLGRPARTPETLLDTFYMDVAASLQAVLEQALLHVTRHLKMKTGEENLCLAGGVALNCVANSKILSESGFKNVWIQPAAGDAGGALGAAMAYWHGGLQKPRIIQHQDSQKGSLLGPEFQEDEIETFLKENKIPFSKLSKDEMLKATSNFLYNKKVVGWFQGKMEFGPRALGSRSILGDAKVPDLQKTMNLKIKFRESFRPFAPLVRLEEVIAYFEFKDPSPYMLFVATLKPEHCLKSNAVDEAKFGIDKLNVFRSIFPAITHVDYSARLQTVDADRHSLLHDLLTNFKQTSGHSVMVNTSFNVRGEPIVCSPEDAYRCFRRTDIDVLILGNYIISKESALPAFQDINWENEFELD
jgi:carbamoyltransferase